ncbi:MAG: magnesium transporter [Elusimicrobia bacterium]|nr:magnesium transporter [Elusimicrobiota bacterium]
MKTLQLYLSDLKELLQSNEFISARTCLKEISPIDLAEGWQHFSPDERVALFRLCTRQRAIQLFEELDKEEQVDLINHLQKEDAEKLLQELDPSQTSRMVRGLPPHLIRHLTGIMQKGSQELVQKYLEYPPKTVGALMRGRYIVLDPKWNCKQALERVQFSTRLRRIEETYLDTLMVADAEGQLLGTVSLKSLVVAPRDMPVRELMDPSPATLSPEMDQEEAVKLFGKYKLKSAPVTTSEGKLMGVVVYRDIFEVAREEVEEDFAKMVGSQAGLLSHSAFDIARVRLPWLVATCVGELLVSAIIKHYELTLSKVVALATFIPLIAAMGGNVGAQTATVMVRGLATGEVKEDDETGTILKEVAVGMMIGAVYGLLVGMSAEIFYGGRYGWKFAWVVGIGMFVSMTSAATAGSIEPLIFRRLGIDPATATGPLITTFTDLLSTIVYFSLATYLLM